MRDRGASGVELTCREAGRRGGEACLSVHGRAYYARIARLRSQGARELRLKAVAGGRTTRARHGAGFYERIGLLGGLVVLGRYGKEHYAAMGRRAQELRRRE